MVEIGHASISENGTARNGKPGDQTGKEVYIRSWYSKGWHTVLRPKDINVANNMTKACIDGCKNPNIGYDQNQRNTLRTEAQKVGFRLSDISNPCETDCSAFMSVCAEAAGVAMSPQYTAGNAPTTANMVKKFYDTGMFDILVDPIYLKSSDYLRHGDVLVCNGHTVMVTTDGPKQLARPQLCKGCKGSWVKVMQGRLVVAGYHLVADGDFGNATYNALRSFQEERGLLVDGICGSNTWKVLLS